MTPTVHLICNAHLDPVWQWRWEEGASEAMATFRNAVEILDRHPSLVFCHNEAVLYQWVENDDPGLFDEIRKLVRAGRWAISGGWFLQPDVNLPGTESLVRHIAEGRRYFRERFGAAPRVAYNFDSFGHSGGLPQILRRAGYDMYIHMRPQAGELRLPADLYRWRGVDGTMIPAYRIAVGLYHTERDNIEERLRAGVELALSLNRDVPVFWGLGNHGGGAAREDLKRIDDFLAGESRLRIVHSTPDRFFDAVKVAAARAPIVEGDLQRSFTGCYTSLSRLKRRAVSNLGGLVKSEALAAAAWWLKGSGFPAPALRDSWQAHLFNDFHDILTGTCVEPAERDALDLYGRSSDLARGIRLGAVAALTRGRGPGPDLPLTVANTNPSLFRVPVEFECMTGYRPFWKGTWRLRLFRAGGREIPCQEEQPEALLPFNGWRRRVCFIDGLPGIGVSRYELKALKIPEGKEGRRKPTRPFSPALAHRIDRHSGLIVALKPRRLGECLMGPLLEPLVIRDTGDSWGTGIGSYRTVAGRFKASGPPVVIADGPIRTITRTLLAFGKSRIVLDTHSYPGWPVLEFRLRIEWNEERRRLKLRIPTRLREVSLRGEVPGGAIGRPGDGEEHVHGRWLALEGRLAGGRAMIGVANNGQHGFDLENGELRLSVLRSVAYCHEQGFDLDAPGREPGSKFADLGVHEIRLLVTAGGPARVLKMLPGLADFLGAPPASYPHLPFGGGSGTGHGPNHVSLLSLSPAHIRLLACKPSWDGRALIVRLQEAVGKRATARLEVGRYASNQRKTASAGVDSPTVKLRTVFQPFEIKTVRVERDGSWREVRLIEEDAP